jgi:hypothetical protein
MQYVIKFDILRKGVLEMHSIDATKIQRLKQAYFYNVSDII